MSRAMLQEIGVDRPLRLCILTFCFILYWKFPAGSFLDRVVRWAYQRCKKVAEWSSMDGWLGELAKAIDDLVENFASVQVVRM
eukprot:7569165-Karenia_brevis.AAC.1